jgi:hypothetical protein
MQQRFPNPAVLLSLTRYLEQDYAAAKAVLSDLGLTKR